MKNKKGKKNRFRDLKIKQKFLLMNLGIIIIMVVILGCCSYFVSRKSLMNSSLHTSEIIMEQLGQNVENNIKFLDDFLLQEIMQFDLGDILNTGQSYITYNQRKEAKQFSYNLMNYNKYIRAVILEDFQDKRYIYAKDTVFQSELFGCNDLDFQNAKELKGRIYWNYYSEEVVFGSRLLYDMDTWEPIGIMSVGINAEYFEELFQNLINENPNESLVMNKNYEVLIQSNEEVGKIVEALSQKYPLSENPNQTFFYEGRKYISTVWSSKKGDIHVVNLINMNAISDQAMSMLMPVLYTGILAVVISIIFSLYMSNLISANIRILMEKIKSMAEGDLSTEIQPESYDEIGMIGLKVNEMSKKIQRLLEEVTTKKIQIQKEQMKALEFEYAALQAKINPHFLYNTLESINSLAKIDGNQEIADSIYLLGNYLRETISEKRRFITLKEEMQNVHDYIKIQQISYRDKLKVKFSLDDILMDTMVPKLILQPLVENAIVHGIEPKVGAGTVEIISRCTGMDMEIEIKDDGIGLSNEMLEQGGIWKEKKTDSHTKVGLLSVHKRIQILYGENYGLKIERRKQAGTKIIVCMPIRFEGEEEENV